MMRFMRKYQKIVYSIIGLTVIASFSFFGTYSTIRDPSSKRENKVIGSAIDGSDIYELEMEALIRFIDSNEEGQSKGRGNFLNDGFVRLEMAKTGLLSQIFAYYKDLLDKGMQEKIERFQKWRPYLHPSKMIGLEAIWKQFLPEVADHFQAFKESKTSQEAVDHLSKLYVSQGMISPELVRRILKYQEGQYANWIRRDGSLDSIDLSLFYAKTLTDWFGEEFVRKIADVIYNGSIMALKEGYRVTTLEAKASLEKIVHDNLSRIDPKRQFSESEFQRFFQEQIRNMHLSEREVITLWKRILLFRKLFQEAANSIFVDSTIYKDFHNYASQKAKIELYRMPQELVFHTPSDLMKFEIYLNAVSSREDALDLPKQFLSVDEVKEITPELVEKRFILRLARVKKKDVALDIPLKKVLEWELEEKHWALLIKEFAELQNCPHKDSDGRCAYLRTLSQDLQSQIDHYAKMKIVEENPHLVKEKLSNTPSEPEIVSITYKGDDEIRPSLSNRKVLLELLEKGPLFGSDEEVNVPILEKLSCYTEDDDTFYRIRIVDRKNDFEILSYKEALDRGILDRLLERKLKEEFNKKLFPIDFNKEKEELGKKIFSPLAKKIVARAGQDEHVLSEKEMWDFAIKARFAQEIMDEEERVKKGMKEEVLSLQNEEKTLVLLQKPPLDQAWKVQKEEITVSRNQGHPLIQEDLFQKEEGSVSLLLHTDEGPVFYKVLEISVDEDSVPKSMEEGRTLLGIESRREVMKTLLEKMEFQKRT